MTRFEVAKSLLADLGSRELRLVSSDWFEEHGEMELAELLRLENKVSWKTLNGRKILFQDLTVSHLSNIVRMMRRNGRRPNINQDLKNEIRLRELLFDNYEIKFNKWGRPELTKKLYAEGLPKNTNWPDDTIQCDLCGGYGCEGCGDRGWYNNPNHPNGRRCRNQDCNKPIPPNFLAVYCSNSCAMEDA